MSETPEMIELTLPAAIVPMIEEFITRRMENRRLAYEHTQIDEPGPDETEIGELAWAAGQFSLEELAALNTEPLVLHVPAYVMEPPDSYPPRLFYFDRIGSEVIAAYIAATGHENCYGSGRPRSVSTWQDLHIAIERWHYFGGPAIIARMLHEAPQLEDEYRLTIWEKFQRRAALTTYSGLGHAFDQIQTMHRAHDEVFHRLARGQFGPHATERMGEFYVEELGRIWATLSEMDKQGNAGWYTESIPHPARWFASEERYLPIRKVTMFWRSGWGWRLRKKSPRHWREAFTAMFPQTVAQLTGETP